MAKNPKAQQPEAAKKEAPRKEAPRKEAPKAEAAPKSDAPRIPAPPARLAVQYREKVVPDLIKRFGYKTVMQVPRLRKITLNMGVGETTADKKEQIIFPEIEYDKIDAIRGMDIAFTTSAKTDDEARALLAAFRFPFKS